MRFMEASIGRPPRSLLFSISGPWLRTLPGAPFFAKRRMRRKKPAQLHFLSRWTLTTNSGNALPRRLP